MGKTKKFAELLSNWIWWRIWLTSIWRRKFRLSTHSCYLKISTFFILVSSIFLFLSSIQVYYLELFSYLFCIFSIDEEFDKVAVSSDDEQKSEFWFIKRRDGEPFRFIIETSCGPTSEAITGNCKGYCGAACQVAEDARKPLSSSTPQPNMSSSFSGSDKRTSMCDGKKSNVWSRMLLLLLP